MSKKITEADIAEVGQQERAEEELWIRADSLVREAVAKSVDPETRSQNEAAAMGFRGLASMEDEVRLNVVVRDSGERIFVRPGDVAAYLQSGVHKTVDEPPQYKLGVSIAAQAALNTPEPASGAIPYWRSGIPAADFLQRLGGHFAGISPDPTVMLAVSTFGFTSMVDPAMSGRVLALHMGFKPSLDESGAREPSTIDNGPGREIS